MPVKSLFSKPIYPVLLTLFFVLHGFAESFFMVDVVDMLKLLLVYMGVTVFLYWLSWLLFRNVQKAALFTFMILAFNYFFGYVHDLLKSAFTGSFIVKYSVILPVAFVCFVLLVILLKKKEFKGSKLVFYLNLLFSIFIIVDIIEIVQDVFIKTNEKEEKLVLSCTQARPDIYFIVADGYAGTSMLSELFHFDNSGFLDSLRHRGFFIANNSRSNYNYTVFSMASILDMEYLSLPSEYLNWSGDSKPALNKLYNNKITNFFSGVGYNIYNYSSFDIKDHPANIKSASVPPRVQLFTAQTLIDRIQRDAWIHIAVRLNLKSTLVRNTFKTRKFNQQVYDQTIQQIKTRDTLPKFVYTHLEFPHRPYFFDEKGVPYSFEEMEADHGPNNPGKYVKYLKYANGKLLYLLDKILKESLTPPVILLISDHGHKIFPGDSIHYTFRNLMSVYLPDRNYSQFNDSLTNVNLFRALLNTSFCQQLPLLKDSMISNMNWEKGRYGDMVTEPAKVSVPVFSQTGQTQDSPDRQHLDR